MRLWIWFLFSSLNVLHFHTISFYFFLFFCSFCIVWLAGFVHYSFTATWPFSCSTSSSCTTPNHLNKTNEKQVKPFLSLITFWITYTVSIYYLLIIFVVQFGNEICIFVCRWWRPISFVFYLRSCLEVCYTTFYY